MVAGNEGRRSKIKQIMNREPTKEELSNRIEDLEDTVEKMIPNRRGIIKGLGALGAVGLASSTATATSDDTEQVGSAEDPVPVYATDVNAESISTNKLGETVMVSSESELREAISDQVPIYLSDNIIIDGLPIGREAENISVDLLLNGHTLTGGENRNLPVLEFSRLNEVNIAGPGRINGNRTNQNSFPETSQPVLKFDDGNKLKLSNFAIVQNPGWALDTDGVNLVSINGVDVDSKPSGLGNNASGLDGFHIGDAQEISINGGHLTTGDDSIVIDAVDVAPEMVNINGVVCSSPELANGIKLLINNGARSSVKWVNIDATVKNAENKSIVITNENNGQLPVENVNISGIYESDGDGIRVVDAAEAININATVNTSGIPVYLTGTSQASIAGVTSAQNSGPHNIKLNNCSKVTISGTHTSCISHAVQIENTQHTVISGCVFKGFDGSPVNSKEGSDFVSVIGNDLNGGSPNFQTGNNNNPSQNI